MAFEYLLIALVWNKVDIKVGQYEELNTCLKNAYKIGKVEYG